MPFGRSYTLFIGAAVSTFARMSPHMAVLPYAFMAAVGVRPAVPAHTLRAAAVRRVAFHPELVDVCHLCRALLADQLLHSSHTGVSRTVGLASLTVNTAPPDVGLPHTVAVAP